jgi:hypothetical protein
MMHRPRRNYIGKSPRNERRQAERRELAEAIASGRVKVYKRKCLYPACGETFETTNPFERYCSPECRRTWQNWDTLVYMKTCLRHAGEAGATDSDETAVEPGDAFEDAYYA